MSVEPGTLDVIDLVAALVVKIPLGLALVGWDERRIAARHPDWYARAYPPATRLASIVVFQEFGVCWHFVRTRWSARGLAVGVAWAIAYLAVSSVPLIALDALLGA